MLLDVYIYIYECFAVLVVMLVKLCCQRKYTHFETTKHVLSDLQLLLYGVAASKKVIA